MPSADARALRSDAGSRRISAGVHDCRGRAGAALVLALVLEAIAQTAAAQIPIVRGEGFRLDLTGYVRTLTGVHDAGWDPPVANRTTGFHGTVTRLKWTATSGDRITITVHNRVLASLTSSGTAPVAGFGVSRPPGRAVDLSSDWIAEERLHVVHDVDRLAITVLTPVADVTLGRQAVSWGTSALLPVADLWTTFSPFELDTEEKPGIDALRLLAYPSAHIEIDALLADRGEDGVSAGARVSVSLPRWELWGGAGRLWNEWLAMAGATLVADVVKLRAEMVLARDTDADETLDPRVTIGVDRIGTRWTASAELHFNGLGTTAADEYDARIVSRSFARGETYYLGRHLAGAAAAWSPDAGNRLSLAASLLANLDDGSVSVTPVATYDLGQHTRISAGAVLSAGAAPVLDAGSAAPRLRSEFGSYGDLGFVRISVYF